MPSYMRTFSDKTNGIWRSRLADRFVPITIRILRIYYDYTNTFSYGEKSASMKNWSNWMKCSSRKIAKMKNLIFTRKVRRDKTYMQFNGIVGITHTHIHAEKTEKCLWIIQCVVTKGNESPETAVILLKWNLSIFVEPALKSVPGIIFGARRNSTTISTRLLP